jgi:hypothetical protein
MRRSLLPVLAASLVPWLSSLSPAATSVSQFGVTWTFDKDYPTGQYVTGDTWVLGPVKIVSITPAPATIGGRAINGTMINPAAGMTVPQGWDSDVQNARYDASVNAGLNLPLTVAPNSSVMSAISIKDPMAADPKDTHAPRLEVIAVLTVVEKAPAVGAFRPPYCGTDKSGDWNESQLKWDLLRKLEPVKDTPDIATFAKKLERPWIEVQTSTGGRYLHPRATQPGYGRDLSYILQDGLLLLHLNYTKEQKRELLVRMVQFGIDVYGAAKSGGYWADLGGFNMGRKMPMVLAGLALDDKKILAYANAKSTDPKGFIFQDDLQTFYVTKEDIARKHHTADNRPREPYTDADLGMAEWGEQHTKQPNRDGRNWDAYYRSICYNADFGHALAARLTPGAVEAWNWPPFFDYMDRAFPKADKPTPFVANMWKAYRPLGGPVSGPPAVPKEGH